MKRLTICFILLISSVAAVISQESEYRIKIIDNNGEWAYVSTLVIDDSISVTHSRDIDDIEENIYWVKLSEGRHHIRARLSEYNLLDTLVLLKKEHPYINLYVDMKNDFHLYEFREDFNKIYTNQNMSPVIGLRKDGTFLFKRFIHFGYIAWYQFESGKYTIKDELLTLNVTESSRNNLNNPSLVSYTYHFHLLNNEITDIDRYGNGVGGLEKSTFTK